MEKHKPTICINIKDVEDIEIEGVDYKDYPKFCDAFITSADYNGKPLTDKELDKVNDDTDFVHSCVLYWIY